MEHLLKQLMVIKAGMGVLKESLVKDVYGVARVLIAEPLISIK
ncbi:hypothetical protein ES703_14398 [subsurface metagenome]